MTPKNLTESRTFLGLVSYYRRFVKKFGNVADPLNRLLNKGERYTWSENCEVEFKQLKSHLISSSMLAYPRQKDIFVVDTDARGEY